jgi:glycyl-tRNA synthetase alpha subunit
VRVVIRDTDTCTPACTGQEVTQYTYFQQAAGLPLPVPSVEITYGLERIMTALQVHP